MISRLFSGKKAVTYDFAEWFGYKTRAGVNMSEARALQVSAVFCAVRVISEGIAQMPIRIRRLEGESRPVVTDHWLHALLNERPNDWQSAYEFVEYAVFLAALCGDFVAVKSTNSRGRVLELLPIPNGHWSLDQKNDYSLEYRVTHEDKTVDVFDGSQVFHLRGPSLDGYKGTHPIYLARESLGLSTALESHQIQLASRGGRPSGVLSTSAQLNAEARTRLKDTWDQKFGASGDGGVAVLDGDWSFGEMQMSSVDAQHIETRKHQIEEVARHFRVFPQMLMQTDKASTFASAEQFFRAHVIHTLGPWIRRFEGAVRRDLIPQRERLVADLDERALLRGDFKDQSEFYTKALGAGGTQAWMTPNEVRADLGMDPIEGGDELSRGAMIGEQQDEA